MMTHARTVAVVLTAALTVALTAQTPAAWQAAASRPIPGITAKDLYPNGCVDCHVAGKDSDMRLSTLMTKLTSAVPASLMDKARASSADPAKIKGKHLPMPNVKANTPQTCLAGCHKKGSTMAPPFAQLMHAIHLTGGGQNRFLSVNQGECTHCHKLDPKTGALKMPSAAEK